MQIMLCSNRRIGSSFVEAASAYCRAYAVRSRPFPLSAAYYCSSAYNCSSDTGRTSTSTHTATTTTNVLKESFNSKSRVLTLTLNRPESHNALSISLLERLGDAMKNAQSDPSVHVIVIEAAQRVGSKVPVFSSGHDLKEISSYGPNDNNDNNDRRYDKYLKLFQLCSQVMIQIMESEKPVIAKVDGIATAAGCQLVASCDLAIATSRSQFATPGVNIGLFCSTPAVPLVRLIGKRNAMHMLLTGDPISAQQAKEIGLINQVIELNNNDDDDDNNNNNKNHINRQKQQEQQQEDPLTTVVTSLAEKIASKSSPSIAIGKRILNQQYQSNNIYDAYDITSNAMAKNCMHPDVTEGVDAFLNKRTPNWPSRRK